MFVPREENAIIFLKMRKPPQNLRAECGVRSERKHLSPPSLF
ncbi:hypothetical protein H1P_630015 [Hyella patelloides LEGE 07179]|uniref:Uncharacterized protein n=1 Tax=Hyella patelloides LEGE 07179 TaxID=945734 RepID=A0A563W1Q2_9CYAN|nr:hypothetical protein H1P_630015 [Hyella patelloides LEGE 07179]